MKGSNSQQKTAFQPKPLTIEQENAIDLLLTGKSDREVAETIGVHRMTVQGWRTHHPVFMATLAERRAGIWRGPQERLRSLMAKAVENIAELVESGDYDASIQLLKITGMYGGLNNMPGEANPEKLIKAQAETQVQHEGIPEDATDHMLINLSKNPLYLRRMAEIEAELRAEYGEAEGANNPMPSGSPHE